MDRERVEETAVSLLTQLSLSDYEARTYVGLLRLGRGSARQVSETVDVPRSRVYDAVEALHEMGLVDIRYGSPKEFIPISEETTLRKFSVKYEDLIEELGDVLEELTPTHTPSEQLGVWTVTGSDNISRRSVEFVNHAAEHIVFFTNADLVTDDLAAALIEAEKRGIDVSVDGIGSENDPVEGIEHLSPDASLDEQLSPWVESHATRLLLVDDEVTLVSVRQGPADGTNEEVAIWGRGNKNSLVVVLRTLFNIQFGDEIDSLDSPSDTTASQSADETDRS